MIPDSDGRKNASAAPYTNVMATMAGTPPTPAMRMAAKANWHAARTTSLAIITVRRDMRSAHTPPTRRNSTRGTARAPSTSPMSPAPPPSAMMAKGTATDAMVSPTALRSCDVNSSRNDRSRRQPTPGRAIDVTRPP